MKVVLKIIKHCKEEENSRELVNGQLVGLVQSATNTLEVTNCFPLYVSETETEESGWCGLGVVYERACSVLPPYCSSRIEHSVSSFCCPFFVFDPLFTVLPAPSLV